MSSPRVCTGEVAHLMLSACNPITASDTNTPTYEWYLPWQEQVKMAAYS